MLCSIGVTRNNLTLQVNTIYWSLAGTAVNDAEEAELIRESLRSLDKLSFSM